MHPDPGALTREFVPDAAQITVPVRGRALRDRFVLRLIAVDKALHALVVGIVAVGVWLVAGDRDAVRNAFLREMATLDGGNANPTNPPPLRLGALTSRIDWVLRLDTSLLRVASVGIGAYALLNAVESFGLWQTRRWAEYLSAFATSVFIPVEVYELVERPTVFKAGTLAANALIVAYLVYAKRLFGLRGGGRVDRQTRAADCSLRAIAEASTPTPSPATPDEPTLAR